MQYALALAQITGQIVALATALVVLVTVVKDRHGK